MLMMNMYDYFFYLFDSDFLSKKLINSLCFDQLIASASLYLAGKLKDDIIKIRDVINVTHNTLNRGNSFISSHNI